MKIERPKIRVVAEKTIKIRKGKVKLREAIKDELARKGSRAGIIIRNLAADTSVVWRPAELDSSASELRYLAFQIRRLQDAKVATEEA